MANSHDVFVSYHHANDQHYRHLFEGLFAATPELLEVAERTDFTRTSPYADVVDFVARAARRSSSIRVARLATSTEGRQPRALGVFQQLDCEAVVQPAEPQSRASPDRAAAWARQPAGLKVVQAADAD